MHTTSPVKENHFEVSEHQISNVELIVEQLCINYNRNCLIWFARGITNWLYIGLEDRRWYCQLIVYPSL